MARPFEQSSQETKDRVGRFDEGKMARPERFEQSSKETKDRVGHFDEGEMARPERFERPTLRFVV